MSSPSFQYFLHETEFHSVPTQVQVFGKRCLIDLIGVMASGTSTELGRLICDHSAQQFGAGALTASIMFDGRSVSPAGAALANGMLIDSIDAHDGYKEAKGHIGCHVLPTLLAFYEAEGIDSGSDFLADLIIGYEIGARAAVSLHASAPDYHTSGAWGAVTSAALGSRILKLDVEQTRHAIGIGEYHGPRSQMMRCIDHPTMLKDGSGWGAMAGVSASYLAASGFTGAPAITVESEETAEYWQDLGSHWTMVEQYFKPYPVCRWAQPATEASLLLTNEHGFTYSDIEKIAVHTFHEACRLATRHPENTEQAQYSLPFPVASALVFGKLGPAEISGDALHDERVARLSESIELKEHEPYNEVFPAQRYAHVEVTLKDGRSFISKRQPARGDPENPLTDEEIVDKYYALSEPVIGRERARAIHEYVMELEIDENFQKLLAALRLPV